MPNNYLSKMRTVTNRITQVTPRTRCFGSDKYRKESGMVFGSQTRFAIRLLYDSLSRRNKSKELSGNCYFSQRDFKYDTFEANVLWFMGVLIDSENIEWNRTQFYTAGAGTFSLDFKRAVVGTMYDEHTVLGPNAFDSYINLYDDISYLDSVGLYKSILYLGYKKSAIRAYNEDGTEDEAILNHIKGYLGAKLLVPIGQDASIIRGYASTVANLFYQGFQAIFTYDDIPGDHIIDEVIDFFQQGRGTIASMHNNVPDILLGKYFKVEMHEPGLGFWEIPEDGSKKYDAYAGFDTFGNFGVFAAEFLKPGVETRNKAYGLYQILNKDWIKTALTRLGKHVKDWNDNMQRDWVFNTDFDANLVRKVTTNADFYENENEIRDELSRYQSSRDPLLPRRVGIPGIKYNKVVYPEWADDMLKDVNDIKKNHVDIINSYPDDAFGCLLISYILVSGKDCDWVNLYKGDADAAKLLYLRGHHQDKIYKGKADSDLLAGNLSKVHASVIANINKTIVCNKITATMLPSHGIQGTGMDNQSKCTTTGNNVTIEAIIDWIDNNFNIVGTSTYVNNFLGGTGAGQSLYNVRDVSGDVIPYLQQGPNKHDSSGIRSIFSNVIGKKMVHHIGHETDVVFKVRSQPKADHVGSNAYYFGEVDESRLKNWVFDIYRKEIRQHGNPAEILQVLQNMKGLRKLDYIGYMNTFFNFNEPILWTRLLVSAPIDPATGQEHKSPNMYGSVMTLKDPAGKGDPIKLMIKSSGFAAPPYDVRAINVVNGGSRYLSQKEWDAGKGDVNDPGNWPKNEVIVSMKIYDLVYHEDDKTQFEKYLGHPDPSNFPLKGQELKFEGSLHKGLTVSFLDDAATRVGEMNGIWRLILSKNTTTSDSVDQRDIQENTNSGDMSLVQFVKPSSSGSPGLRINKMLGGLMTALYDGSAGVALSLVARNLFQTFAHEVIGHALHMEGTGLTSWGKGNSSLFTDAEVHHMKVQLDGVVVALNQEYASWEIMKNLEVRYWKSQGTDQNGKKGRYSWFNDPKVAGPYDAYVIKAKSATEDRIGSTIIDAGGYSEAQMEDELMARFFSLMLTIKCITFKKDIYPRLQLMGITLSASTIDAVDNEFKNVMKIDMRTY